MLLLSYHLYDETGRVAADSHGFQHYPRGLTIASEAGEQLLGVPKNPSEPFQYRLYNSEGLLLTWSDGARTKIYPCLRMDGTAHGWTRPVATK